LDGARILNNSKELIGRTFLLDKQDNCQQFLARVVKVIDDRTCQLENDKDRMKILLSLDEDAQEEVITYNQLLDYLARDNDNDIVWKFNCIVSHQGPITSNHPDYNGSTCSLLIEWENGETTKEPLQAIAKDDPVICAICAKGNGLLDLSGWKQFKSIARRQKKGTRMVNQAKLKSFNNATKFKNGYKIPQTYEQAMQFDEKNGNTKWQDAIALELQQINEYETFTDVGHHNKAKIQMVIRRSGFILFLMSNMMDVMRQGWLQMDASLKFHWNLSTLELLVYKDSVKFSS
jgi:hypothetical protein